METEIKMLSDIHKNCRHGTGYTASYSGCDKGCGIFENGQQADAGI